MSEGWRQRQCRRNNSWVQLLTLVGASVTLPLVSLLLEQELSDTIPYSSKNLLELYQKQLNFNLVG